MTHKTKLISLGILGTIAAAGALSCCVLGWFNEPGAGGRGGVHRAGGRGFGLVPLFFGGGGGRAPQPNAPHTGPSSPRGGFGASGSHTGGVGA